MVDKPDWIGLAESREVGAAGEYGKRERICSRAAFVAKTEIYEKTYKGCKLFLNVKWYLIPVRMTEVEIISEQFQSENRRIYSVELSRMAPMLIPK